MKTKTLTLLCLAACFVGAASADEVTRFRAVLDNQQVSLPSGVTSTETRMSAVADFLLTVPAVGSPTLAYDVLFEGIDVVGGGDPTDDLVAVHIHDTTGVEHTASTPHVLNIYGPPAFDDNDANLDPGAARLTGLWDDSDLSEGMLAGNPMGNSDTLSSMLQALESGELYLMLHTTSDLGVAGPGSPTIGGRIVAIPEPGAALLGLLALATGAASRRGR